MHIFHDMFEFLLIHIFYLESVMKRYMKSKHRPHSAKPARTFIPSANGEEGTIEQPIRHFIKMGKKQIPHVMSVSNDLSRLLPKKIHHDKQQLYYDNMQLKTTLNEINEENLRLKTKIALMQREKDRSHKVQHSALGKGQSVNNLNLVKNEKQNGIVNGLKKIVREVREENDALKTEISKLKKTVRYTKLNEVQIQKLTIYEQNKKLAKLIQQYEAQLTSRIRQDQNVKNLQNELNQKIKTLKEVTADNIRYQEILEEIEAQYSETSEKLLIQEKKWQRNFSVEKRKCEQLTKHVQLLKNQVKSLTQKLEEEKKKNSQQKKTNRPASSHPYQNMNSDNGKTSKEKEEALQMNSRLKVELQQAKKKLAESQNRLKTNLDKNATNTLEYSKNQTFELALTKNQENLPKGSQEEQYGQDFQQNASNIPVNSSSLPIQEKKQMKNNKNSAILEEIKEILTYRLKYNRYTYQQLKEDIEVSPDPSFAYQDLMNMLVGEPFYLTKHYAEQFLQVCYKKSKIKNDDELSLPDLVKGLRLIVDDFQLKDEEEQETILYKIAQNLTKNRKLLETEFLKVRDHQNCVTKTQLINIIKKISKLNDEQIDLAVCYISVNTETLHSISYTDFLDRFYINSSKSLKNISQAKDQDELSMGQNQNLDDGELIEDDEIV